ncbi:hypothetical protein EHO59_04730 [Leptospira semungkisensis]|uniref:Uncharacterized protein n=1 Tax=Leptospira semungkisensis TaxID=2484985 RepID=A0A4R9G8Q8_9LEPT|nr:hypothetical protein EHO59_04730 [Leptospira semungkisensis]
MSIIGFEFLPREGFELGLKVGSIIAVISCLFIAFFTLKKKNLHAHIGFILVGLLAGLLAVFIGGVGGLIPCAYLSTLPVNNDNN